MAAYANINKAIDAMVVDGKLDMFNKLKKAILDELDEESASTIGALFDKFKNDNAADFKASAPAALAKKGRGKKAADDKPRKKRGPSAYNMFAKEQVKIVMAEHKELKSKEAMAKVGAMWQELSADDKKKYVELAKAAVAAPVPAEDEPELVEPEADDE